MFRRGHNWIAVLATAVGLLVVPGSAAAADLAGTVTQVQSGVEQVVSTAVGEVAAAPAPAPVEQTVAPVRRVVEAAGTTTGDVTAQPAPAVERAVETTAALAPPPTSTQEAVAAEATAPAAPAAPVTSGPSETTSQQVSRRAHGVSATARHASPVHPQREAVAPQVVAPSPRAIDQAAPSADRRQLSEPAGRQTAPRSPAAPAPDLPDTPPAGGHAMAAPSGSLFSAGLALLVGVLLFGIARGGTRLLVRVRPHRAGPFLAALERPG